MRKVMKIILATTNPNKLREIKEIANNINFDLELINEDFDPIENGSTFRENAYIKAYEAAKMTDQIALADDTGLCIDVLGGAPGIYSARYAPTPKEKIEKILRELSGETNRNAHFECSMILVNPDGKVLFSSVGRIDGCITNEPSGCNGFGYDPIFFVPQLNKTMAEMTLEEKNSLSHRSRALVPMIEWIEQNLAEKVGQI